MKWYLINKNRSSHRIASHRIASHRAVLLQKSSCTCTVQKINYIGIFISLHFILGSYLSVYYYILSFHLFYIICIVVVNVAVTILLFYSKFYLNKKNKNKIITLNLNDFFSIWKCLFVIVSSAIENV